MEQNLTTETGKKTLWETLVSGIKEAMDKIKEPFRRKAMIRKIEAFRDKLMMEKDDLMLANFKELEKLDLMDLKLIVDNKVAIKELDQDILALEELHLELFGVEISKD